MTVRAGVVPKEAWDALGWWPRSYQSRHYVLVPEAMLEEARDSLPGGDARDVLTIILVGARVTPSPNPQEAR